MIEFQRKLERNQLWTGRKEFYNRDAMVYSALVVQLLCLSQLLPDVMNWGMTLDKDQEMDWQTNQLLNI